MGNNWRGRRESVASLAVEEFTANAVESFVKYSKCSSATAATGVIHFDTTFDSSFDSSNERRQQQQQIKETGNNNEGREVNKQKFS